MTKLKKLQKLIADLDSYIESLERLYIKAKAAQEGIDKAKKSCEDYLKTSSSKPA